jgi:hypothetical protein
MRLLSNGRCFDKDLRLTDEECDIWHMETVDGFRPIKTKEDLIDVINNQTPFRIHWLSPTGYRRHVYLGCYFNNVFYNSDRLNESSKFVMNENYVITVFQPPDNGQLVQNQTPEHPYRLIKYQPRIKQTQQSSYPIVIGGQPEEYIDIGAYQIGYHGGNFSQAYGPNVQISTPMYLYEPYVPYVLK